MMSASEAAKRAAEHVTAMTGRSAAHAAPTAPAPRAATPAP